MNSAKRSATTKRARHTARFPHQAQESSFDTRWPAPPASDQTDPNGGPAACLRGARIPYRSPATQCHSLRGPSGQKDPAARKGRRLMACLIPISQAEAALRSGSLFRSRKAVAAVLLSRGDSAAIHRKCTGTTRIFMTAGTYLPLKAFRISWGKGSKNESGTTKSPLAAPIRGSRTSVFGTDPTSAAVLHNYLMTRDVPSDSIRTTQARADRIEEDAHTCAFQSRPRFEQNLSRVP